MDSFIAHGRLTVRFSESMMRAWRRGGGKGSGFDIVGQNFVLNDPAGAVFANFITNPDFVGTVTLTFSRLPTTPKQTYFIDAIQVRSPTGDPIVPALVGGVSYEIRLSRR